MISLETRVYPLPSRAKHPQVGTPTVYALVGKRLFDLLATLLITSLVLFWLVPVIALAIALTSPGPVFFVQLRTGRNGRPFRCLKFRTTTHNVHQRYRPSTRYESEVTSAGRFLRTTGFDELPNFFNILVGEMSIVGPRPHTLQYDAEHWTQPGYRDRQTVRPGITGLVQTRVCHDATPGMIQLPHLFRYDRWYVRRYSLLLDFKICWWAITGKLKATS
jgi:putative colanic acid biosynthesis UDP-glucose lipid carrier transferase